jgi:hypothetical protein
MKPKSMKTILLAALMAPGALFAQTTATTTPVGYETVNLAPGFNYMGLRLHNSPVISGTFETINNSSFVDTGVDIAAVLENGKTYIVEIVNTAGVGAVAEIVKANASTGTITTPNTFASLGVAAGAKYAIRASATLASVFGATNTVGLSPGFSGPGGADLIYIPDGTGGFDQYFYDEDETTWKNIAANVPIVYLDGVVVFTNSPETVIVSGEIKKEPVFQMITPGFNYLSSIYPASATLGSTLGGSLASIKPGFSGPGDADLIYVVDGSIKQYFYDEDESSWKNAETNSSVDPNAINFPSGIIYFSASSTQKVVKSSSPTFYSSL